MRINDLVNKVEPFRFEYDGFVLEGEWFKYRTTTPQYAKQQSAKLPKVSENGSETDKRATQIKRNEVLEEIGFQAVADMIKSWNAEDDTGQALPPTRETFEQLPQPFIDRFLDFLKGLRDENPPSPSSQST